MASVLGDAPRTFLSRALRSSGCWLVSTDSRDATRMRRVSVAEMAPPQYFSWIRWRLSSGGSALACATIPAAFHRETKVLTQARDNSPCKYICRQELLLLVSMNSTQCATTEVLSPRHQPVRKLERDAVYSYSITRRCKEGGGGGGGGGQIPSPGHAGRMKYGILCTKATWRQREQQSQDADIKDI